MSHRPRVLVVEDQPIEREGVTRLLQMEDYSVVAVGDAKEALDYIGESWDLVISDLRMTGHDTGLDLLRAWKDHRRQVPFILMTGYGDVESAVAAMKLGAVDYLLKPVDPDELLKVVGKCLMARGKVALGARGPELSTGMGFERIIGESPAVVDLLDKTKRAAETDCTVLIIGESGTGKELIAEAIHANSPRRTGPFVAMNMAAVPESLVESELFGHKKGAFTGAATGRVGRFEAAHGGTLFIDEIGDFALSCQSKLLRVLETRTVTPIGGNEDMKVDVRVVAATSRDLFEMMDENQFREDLYYRLNVVTINLPPLRERRGDIPLLIQHFMKDLRETYQKPDMALDDELTEFLNEHDWPGNIRQLRNLLERMVVLSRGDLLTLDDLPRELSRRAPSDDGDDEMGSDTKLEKIERTAILQALEKVGGNKSRAAELLGISVRTLHRRLKRWDVLEAKGN